MASLDLESLARARLWKRASVAARAIIDGRTSAPVNQVGAYERRRLLDSARAW